ncbi:MAG: hypothetical protein WC068_03845 [Caulobacter sp.]
MNRRILLIAGALLLAGCATRAVYSAPDVGMVELEPLLAVTAAREGLTIRVASNGCTGKDSMAWFVEKAGGRYAVAFGRRRVDSCTQPPTAVDLTFSFAELGLPKGARVAVVNPLSASGH